MKEKLRKMRIVMKLFESFTTVTLIPGNESSKIKAIPEQTAPGKETTNPLIADALLKSIIKDNTDPNLQGLNQ